MLAVSFVLFALLGHAISAPAFIPRDDSPSDTDLFLSCPGAAGSPNIERADKCTLINIVNNPDIPVVTNLGDVQGNCEGGTSPIMLTIGGETTVSTTTTANADVGVDLDGFSIGGGISTESGSSTTQSKSTMVSVPPGRQSVMTMSVLSHSQSGNVQVNFGDRVDGHFIWFTGATITQVTPTDQVTFDVHETACGTDPLDLNNHS
ncbi:hypothetical protein MSAN_02303600 [Mycena sanguinolenta]|uniref:Polygalacturonase n=1 Tax=Mycena sanguinolenta TaxID=230812 RepID=A0A8H7CG77_9AGAR|nr:hypothetical protein MSAN_02303600 [Mycena sanguinolenta]